MAELKPFGWPAPAPVVKWVIPRPLGVAELKQLLDADVVQDKFFVIPRPLGVAELKPSCLTPRCNRGHAVIPRPLGVAELKPQHVLTLA